MLLTVGFGLLAVVARAQPNQVDVANRHEDVRLLTQRLDELQIRVEQLERQNNELRSQAGAAGQTYATVAQLNDAVAELNRTIKAAAAQTKTETLDRVSIQMEKLAKQTQAALDALAKNQATRPPVAPPVFTENYPKDGISYTVQKGDTLSSIAKKTDSSVRDIINANKIADPTRLMVGQTLFIPQGSASKN
ncbi:MAG: LysM peptidoglycan-binding domain-containing protein [Verrucomicrobiota bacterium]|nr:LysM peptidoglycan-binding domain-containing protein [Verrucomicrobiota bacterium]